MNIKSDFPIFKSNPDLIYLDSTATSLKPQRVLDAVLEYYTDYSANVHRGIYDLSEKATTKYEEAREKVAAFIHANSSSEIIFTKNATEALNLVAYSYLRDNIEEGDEVVTTLMEHHANFVPWQQMAFENGLDFKVLQLTLDGYLQNLKKENFDESHNPLTGIITKKTKLLALTYISNVLGTINPIKEIARAAKELNPNIIIVVDGAQAVPHMPVNVQELGVDFFAFSSHKMMGPTGVGVLWGKKELLNGMVPFLYGGDMIERVTLEQTTFKSSPHKFEAGTPPIGEVIGLGAAVDYLTEIGMENIREHEKELVEYAIERFAEVKGVHVFGPSNGEDRGGIFSFTYKGFHPHDIAHILNGAYVAVRAGHHCAMPLHHSLGAQATTRASFYAYTEKKDIDALIEGLHLVSSVLSK